MKVSLTNVQQILSYVRQPINTQYDTKYIQPIVRYSPFGLVFQDLEPALYGSLFLMRL